MNISVNDLSPDQREAYNSIVRWIADAREEGGVLTLGGYAGSGKSTLVSLVAEQTNLPAFCAYTGKATSVLRRKLRAAGIQTTNTRPRDEDDFNDDRPFCGTIHSLIYQPCECHEPQIVETKKPCPDCGTETSLENGCANGHAALSPEAFEALKPKKKHVYVQKDANGKCKLCNNDGWLRREILDRAYSLIIVDEASMVTDQMLHDLRSHNVPILAVGDHGQLPPVGGSGSLMKAPNLRLEKIHRQAEGNSIIALSKTVREEGRLPDSEPSGDAVRFGRLRDYQQFLEERYAGASAERLLEMGLAVYKNATRGSMNNAIRHARGIGLRDLPKTGEHLVCLRNMKIPGQEPVSNGMRGVLTSDTKPVEKQTHLEGDVEFVEDEIRARSYRMLTAQFGREKTFQDPAELAKEAGIWSFQHVGSLFDFGYAMTVHKMQGSQFDDLLVCAERPGPVDNESWRRWLYTACTRASKKLTVLR